MISNYHTNNYRESYQQNRSIANVIANNPLSKLQVDRDTYQKYEHYYDVTTTPKPKVTNQKSSGRCWIFAALNVIRREVIKKYKVENFEFSQSYLFFWDKLERLNYGMEQIIATRDQAVGSREVMHLLKDPSSDGGQWDMFCNLVKKYGLVPKSVYRETYHSSNSKDLNMVLNHKFREYAMQLRVSRDPQSHKQKCLTEVYSILCQFLGEPPKEFTWLRGNIQNVKPKDFYEKHVPFNVDDFICIVNDPRNPYNQLYTVKFLGNVIEGKPTNYLNLPIEDLRELALASLKENQTVWFGCDVMQHFNKEECAMDIDLVNHASLLGIKYFMNKEQRLQYGESLMTHAMVFTGSREGHWQVENSWAETGPEKGYYNMSDAWFDEYVFEVVVPKRLLTKAYNKVAKELPPWDPMGALA